MIQLTNEQITVIRDNYKTLPISRISKMLNLSFYKVSLYCKDNGLKREIKQLSEADKQFIRNNYNSMKELDMCKVLGFHRIYIQRFKAEEGLARYSGNKEKVSAEPVAKGFFNVDERLDWVA